MPSTTGRPSSFSSTTSTGRRPCSSGCASNMKRRAASSSPQTSSGARPRVKGAICAVNLAGVPCQALPDGATVETGDSDYERDALDNANLRVAAVC
jgi:hypothetical protein